MHINSASSAVYEYICFIMQPQTVITQSILGGKGSIVYFDHDIFGTDFLNIEILTLRYGVLYNLI